MNSEVHRITITAEVHIDHLAKEYAVYLKKGECSPQERSGLSGGCVKAHGDTITTVLNLAAGTIVDDSWDKFRKSFWEYRYRH